jgi:hypothetical protein
LVNTILPESNVETGEENTTIATTTVPIIVKMDKQPGIEGKKVDEHIDSELRDENPRVAQVKVPTLPTVDKLPAL